MADSETQPGGGARAYSPPPEDAYLNNFLGVVALDAALKRGIVEKLAQQASIPLSALGLAQRASNILLAMLVQNGVCQYVGGANSDDPDIGLTAAFSSVYASRRDILEQKLNFTRLAARDLLDGFPDLLFDLPKFMERSQTFALFRYDKAIDCTPENVEHTRLWTEYVTALTESEAAGLLSIIDLKGCRRMLEIGGNTGAFSLQLLQHYPEMQATIMDLPVVCRLGEEYARGKPGADRLQFSPGDARRDPWPQIANQNPDLIVFKSVLHDWPEPDTAMMLDRAMEVLAPGGCVMICERGPLEDETLGSDNSVGLPFAMASNLVFSPFYRPAEFYVDALLRRGFDRPEVRQVKIEMTFNVVSATRSGADR